MILSAGGQDGGRPPLWANANELIGLITSSKNISDGSDDNSAIKVCFLFLAKDVPLTSARCWILMEFGYGVAFEETA